MIPIHDRSKSQQKKIVIHQLSQLSDYDTTQAHRHNYFEFFVFEKGGGSHLIDFEIFQIESNSIHIVAPGQVHQVKRELSSNGFVFLFDLAVFNTNSDLEDFLFNHICLGVSEFQPNYLFSDETSRDIINVANKAWREFNNNKNLKNSLIKNYLDEMLLYCIREKKLDKLIEDKHIDLYISFRKKLKKSYKELKKVKDYASILAVSEKKLNEIVHERSGETASALIFKQLILEAKRLLNSGLTSKEIAYELNFTDPSHFSKFFKNQTGISPTDFKIVHE